MRTVSSTSLPVEPLLRAEVIRRETIFYFITRKTKDAGTGSARVPVRERVEYRRKDFTL